MNLKETLDKMLSLVENKNQEEIVTKLKEKAQELNLNYTAIHGGRDTIILIIDFPDDKDSLWITIFNDNTPVKFQYKKFVGGKEDILKFDTFISLAKVI